MRQRLVACPGRGRDADCPAPRAQTPTGGIPHEALISDEWHQSELGGKGVGRAWLGSIAPRVGAFSPSSAVRGPPARPRRRSGSSRRTAPRCRSRRKIPGGGVGSPNHVIGAATSVPELGLWRVRSCYAPASATGRPRSRARRLNLNGMTKSLSVTLGDAIWLK